MIASAVEYRNKVEHAGLAFAAVRPSFAEIERDLGLDRAQITQRCVAHHDFLFRKVVAPYLQASFDDLLRLTTDADLVLTSSLAFGARLAAEKRALPWIGIALQPFMFLSAFDPPVMPQSTLLSALLRTLNPRGRPVARVPSCAAGGRDSARGMRKLGLEERSGCRVRAPFASVRACRRHHSSRRHRNAGAGIARRPAAIDRAILCRSTRQRGARTTARSGDGRCATQVWCAERGNAARTAARGSGNRRARATAIGAQIAAEDGAINAARFILEVPVTSALRRTLSHH